MLQGSVRCDHDLPVAGYGQSVIFLRNLVKSERVLSIDLMLRGMVWIWEPPVCHGYMGE